MFMLLAFAPAANATVVFNGDFSPWNLGQWPLPQFCSGAFSFVSYPVYPASTGAPAGQFNVTDSQAFPDCAATSGNPRAQLATNPILAEGQERYIGFKFWLHSLPPVGPSSWYVLQQNFGQPFSGSPPVALQLKADANNQNRLELTICHDGCGATTTIFRSGIINTGVTYTIVLHYKFSKSDANGFVEIFLASFRPRTMLNGATRYYTRTMHQNATGLYRGYINSYMSDNLLNGGGVASSTFDDYVIADTLGEAL